MIFSLAKPTETVFVFVELPLGPVTVSEIVLTPIVEYVTDTGPAEEDVAGFAPAPKFQAYEVIDPEDVFEKVSA